MGLKIFKDAGATQEIKPPQKFVRANATDVGTYKNYTLTKMTGNELASLYKSNGTVHTKLTVDTDFTLSGTTNNNITLTVGLGDTELLLALPTGKLDMNFGGTTGTSKTTSTLIYAKRDTGFVYDTLRISSEDLDITSTSITETAGAISFTANSQLTNSQLQTVTGSLGEGFTSTFIAGALEGLAVVLNGTFIGTVLANTTNSILVNNTSYTHAADPGNDVIELFSIGQLLFALDVDGSVPQSIDFVSVLSLPNLDLNRNQVAIWVRNTNVIPATAKNVPDQAFKIVGVEYTE